MCFRSQGGHGPAVAGTGGDRYTRDMYPPVRLVAIDMDGTLLPTFSQSISRRNAQALKAAQEAGITVAIATGRRTAYTAPLLDGLGLQADTPLITSNGAVTRTLGGDAMDRRHLEARVARGLCGLLRGIQGMVCGGLSKMKDAEKALKRSEWNGTCECVRTEYAVRDLSILDLLPPGVSKGSALERLATRLGIDRKETMAIGDNWNDVDMLEWAGQGVLMGNAALELRAMSKMRGWKQAPHNDEDGVAAVLETAVARRAAVKV